MTAEFAAFCAGLALGESLLARWKANRADIPAHYNPDLKRSAPPGLLREVGLSRDVYGMCVVTLNGREVIRDNGDVISHFATPDWLAEFGPKP